MKKHNPPKALGAILAKSYLRAGKLWLVIGSVALICGMLVSAAWGLYVCDKQQKTTHAKELFGNYQMAVIDTPTKTIEAIRSLESVKRSAVFQQTIIQTPEGIENTILTSPEYFNLERTKLVAGTFPQTAKEVLIEASTAYQMGWENEESLGQTITLRGNEYLVSGVVDNVPFQIVGLTAQTYLFNAAFFDPPETCSVLLESDSADYHALWDSVARTYGVAENQRYDNAEALHYVGIDSTGKPSGFEANIFRVVLFLLGLLSTVLLCTLLLVYLTRIQKTNAIYRAVGIPKRKMGLVFCLLAVSVVLIGYLLSYSAVMKLLSARYDVAFSTLLISRANREIWILFALSAASILLLAFVFFYQSVNRSVVARIQNTNMVRAGKARAGALHNGRALYFRLAMQNLKTTKAKTALFVGMIAVCGVLFCVTTYVLQIYKSTQVLENHYDYKLAFQYKNPGDMFEGTQAHRELYQKIAEEKNEFSAYPVFMQRTSAVFDLADISPSHRTYLQAQSNSFTHAFHNPSLKKLSLPVVLMYADTPTLRRFGVTQADIPELEPGQCFAVCQTIGLMGSGFQVDLQPGDVVGIDTSGSMDVTPEQTDLTVVKSFEEIHLNLDELRDIPILFLDYDTYMKCASLDYPSYLFLDVPEGRPDRVMAYFQGNPGLSITDLSRENKLTEQAFQLMQASLSGIFTLLVLFLVATMAFILYLRYLGSRKQYQMLRAIGIRDGKVLRIFWYEIFFVAVSAVCLSSAVSVAATCLICFYFREEFFYFPYQVPVSELLMIAAVLFLAAAASYLPVILHLKRDAMQEVLKEE